MLIKTPPGSGFIPKDLCGIAAQQRKRAFGAKALRGGYLGMKTPCILMPEAGWGSVAFPQFCNPGLCFPAGHMPGTKGVKQKGQCGRRWPDGEGCSAGLGTAGKETAANPAAASKEATASERVFVREWQSKRGCTALTEETQHCSRG